MPDAKGGMGGRALMPDAEVVAEPIGVTDDGELVVIYVEAEPFHRQVVWLVLFFSLPTILLLVGLWLVSR